MLYKVGDKVLVKPLEEFEVAQENLGIVYHSLNHLAGKVVTIKVVNDYGEWYQIAEDPWGYLLDDTCFVGLDEEYQALCERAKNNKVDNCEVER